MRQRKGRGRVRVLGGARGGRGARHGAAAKVSAWGMWTEYRAKGAEPLHSLKPNNLIART